MAGLSRGHVRHCKWVELRKDAEKTQVAIDKNNTFSQDSTVGDGTNVKRSRRRKSLIKQQQKIYCQKKKIYKKIYWFK